MRTDIPVTHIMVPDPVTVEVGQPLGDARRALSSERFHHLPVLRDGKLVGMVSTTDLLRHSLGEADAEGNSFLDQQFGIEDVMQKDVISIGHRATVAEAAQILSAGGFHALPVVDSDGRLRGLLTSTDLIEFLLESPPEPAVPAAAAQRLKSLEAVFKAAELYLHSGLAESEHARLERAIQAARNGR